MKKNVDLALRGPSGSISPSDGAAVNYPEAHLSGPDQLNLPDEGTITFKYRLRRETSTKLKGGEERYDCDIELKKLVSVTADKPDAPTKKYDEAGDALDKLMKEKESASEGKDSGDEKY